MAKIEKTQDLPGFRSAGHIYMYMYITLTDLMTAIDHGCKGVHPEGYLLNILVRIIALYAQAVAVVIVDVETVREERIPYKTLSTEESEVMNVGEVTFAGRVAMK